MQKDLFGSAVAASVLPVSSEPKFDFLQKHRFTFRLDQVIVGALGFLVAYVLVFSFGVESGKRYAMAEIKAERAMRERMARELGEKIFANSNQPAEASKLSSITASKPAPVGQKDIPASKIPVPSISTPAAELKKSDSSASEFPTPTMGRYLIQTVTFTSKASAEKHLNSLKAKGYQGMIIARGKFQQVCIGGYETRQKAAQVMAKLKSQGLAPKDAYIRPVA